MTNDDSSEAGTLGSDDALSAWEAPLHSGPLPEDGYWGCMEPERKHEKYKELWDERCPKCVLRMKLVMKAEGLFGMEMYEPGGGPKGENLQQALERIEEAKDGS